MDLSRIQQNNFVVVGRAGMDFYPDPPGTRTQDASKFTACLGGSSANISAAITRLGGAASLVTCVSDDAIGRFCLKQLDHYSIARNHVRMVGGEARNSLAVVESRIEDHQSVIYRNGAADFEMSVADVDAVDYGKFGAFITTGTVFAAEPSRSAAFRSMELAKNCGLPVIFDVDYRPYSWSSAETASLVYSQAAELCDIVVGNDVEFGFMAGNYDHGLEKARELALSTAKIVVYKMGEKGSITFADGIEFETGIFPAKPLKPTGAGDAFLGGFVSSLAEGLNVSDSVRRGSASAAIVVGRVGCAPAMPTTDELNLFLSENAEPLTV